MERILTGNDQKGVVFLWEETKIKPFNELIVSWNAARPTNGSYLIQLSLLFAKWSPWFDYAFWGTDKQYTFRHHIKDFHIEVEQDVVSVLQNNVAKGFKIRLLCQGNASLKEVKSLYFSAIDQYTHRVSFTPIEEITLKLPVKGISQMALPDGRGRRLCSPTSTAAVINFLAGKKCICPVLFAHSVVDATFDSYGNWILNTAQASYELIKPWYSYVIHLSTFNQLVDQLIQGHPVIVSVKGPLNGGALPYLSGHLLVVIGYDSTKGEVFCMDPAFPTDESTHVSYALKDFLQAWNKRRGIAYLFQK